jgi:hypothetical protein
MSPYNGPSIGEIIIDNYEDSVFHFTRMSQGIFGGIFKDEDAITLGKVLDQSAGPEAQPIVVGVPRLCIYWFACDEECNLQNAN